MTGTYKDGFLYLTLNNRKFKLTGNQCLQLINILIIAAHDATPTDDTNTPPTDATFDAIPTFGNHKFRL